MTLRGIADEMQRATRGSDLAELTEGMYAHLPEPVLTPAAAYERLVGGTTEMVGLNGIAGRVSATMVVPYPPGIPVIMPGERFPTVTSALLRYLAACQEFDSQFPEFETEIHGVHVADGIYQIPCLLP